MAKPILSELEYNADDVASAILSQADLSVTNEDLGVTDRSSDFSIQSGWSDNYSAFYSFNGFMFVMFYASHAGGVPDHMEAIFSNSNDDTRTSEVYVFPSVGSEGDTSANIRALTDGDIVVSAPVGAGDPGYFVNINGWYRF